jgi:hypothetical protein
VVSLYIGPKFGVQNYLTYGGYEPSLLFYSDGVDVNDASWIDFKPEVLGTEKLSLYTFKTSSFKLPGELIGEEKDSISILSNMEEGIHVWTRNTVRMGNFEKMISSYVPGATCKEVGGVTRCSSEGTNETCQAIIANLTEHEVNLTFVAGNDIRYYINPQSLV